MDPLGNPLVRIALFLVLFGFDYRNGSIAGAKPALIAALCDGLERLAIGAAGYNGL